MVTSSYWDNDIIHKLAALDLVEDAIQTFGLTVGEVRVLATAPYRFFLNDPDRAARRWGSAVAPRIHALLRASQTLTDSPPPPYDSLKRVLTIDAGEAQLLAFAAVDPAARLFTGDKRALAGLATAPSCASVVASLQGRVVCLEQVVQAVIGAKGFEHVRSCAAQGLHCDTVLRIVFGSDQAASLETVEEGLRSYVGELRSNTKGLFVPSSAPARRH